MGVISEVASQVKEEMIAAAVESIAPGDCILLRNVKGEEVRVVPEKWLKDKEEENKALQLANDIDLGEKVPLISENTILKAEIEILQALVVEAAEWNWMDEDAERTIPKEVQEGVDKCREALKGETNE